MASRYRAGIIGFGRMGRGFAAAMLNNSVYELAAICDLDPAAREEAQQFAPKAGITANAAQLINDKSLDIIGIFTLADARPELLKQALKAKKHVIAEKPLAADVKTEWALVRAIERAQKRGQLTAVNIFNRNAWYHKELQQYIADGEIGQLAIVRVCHMTPGHMPGEGHEPEGPAFHDCGMHYVDVARWYARSEFKTWHAQGINMWAHQEPWWIQCHGTFANGVVFDITQGFVYGHLAKTKTHNCYVDLIGTKGIARMRHDFKDATIEVHGTTRTVSKTAPFNDKKLDVMVDIFARSLMAGKNLGYPTARDSVIASEMAWKMYHDAVKHQPPAVGTPAEMEEILRQRKQLRNGYGLPLRHEPGLSPSQVAALGHIEESRACGEDACQAAAPKAARSEYR